MPSRYSELMLPKSRPVPSHRHAAPMGPWPWVGRSDEHDESTIGSPGPPLSPCSHTQCSDCADWNRYPQSQFPNWTPAQIAKSGIERAVEEYKGPGIIHAVDVLDTGEFKRCDSWEVTEGNKIDYWRNELQKPRVRGVRVRALFVENLGGDMLQMFGTKYNIEPFFFSSSLNWIPSRYQENLQPQERDHITITLTFLRMENLVTSRLSRKASTISVSVDQVINAQAPLILRTQTPSGFDTKVLLLDLLAIHMVRDPNNSTIISYHLPMEDCTTSAKDLRARVLFAGESVYWQHIFKNSDDPTFVLLAILWHALYMWDEALQALYAYFCWLESQVIGTNNMDRTLKLHAIRAHLLHYASLLEDFRKSVVFIHKTPNPALDSNAVDENERTKSRNLLENECNNLLSEIKRLESWRVMLDKRVKNVMDLVFATVNIRDSHDMRRLTEAALRDSAAMKQISYLTMVFLPASFVASLFGMNVKELNDGSRGTLVHYVEIAIPFTLVTIWIIMAYRSMQKASDSNTNGAWSMWDQLLWPVTFVKKSFSRRHGKEAKDIELT